MRFWGCTSSSFLRRSRARETGSPTPEGSRLLKASANWGSEQCFGTSIFGPPLPLVVVPPSSPACPPRSSSPPSNSNLFVSFGSFIALSSSDTGDFEGEIDVEDFISKKEEAPAGSTGRKFRPERGRGVTSVPSPRDLPDCCVLDELEKECCVRGLSGRKSKPPSSSSKSCHDKVRPGADDEDMNAVSVSDTTREGSGKPDPSLSVHCGALPYLSAETIVTTFPELESPP
mmetsp:Transcript_6343/g.12594  ORF Transcript_6343/g.12594 Transcript_6343/m.12594 type:complete len:230 (-) Transcript_6343:1335-2024(-)